MNYLQCYYKKSFHHSMNYNYFPSATSRVVIIMENRKSNEKKYKGRKSREIRKQENTPRLELALQFGQRPRKLTLLSVSNQQIFQVSKVLLPMKKLIQINIIFIFFFLVLPTSKIYEATKIMNRRSIPEKYTFLILNNLFNLFTIKLPFPCGILRKRKTQQLLISNDFQMFLILMVLNDHEKQL